MYVLGVFCREPGYPQSRGRRAGLELGRFRRTKRPECGCRRTVWSRKLGEGKSGARQEGEAAEAAAGKSLFEGQTGQGRRPTYLGGLVSSVFRSGLARGIGVERYGQARGFQQEQSGPGAPPNCCPSLMSTFATSTSKPGGPGRQAPLSQSTDPAGLREQDREQRARWTRRPGGAQGRCSNPPVRQRLGGRRPVRQERVKSQDQTRQLTTWV
ncbi:hypothetical protein QBC39DRAFT_133974 [Podospora conica]|nr:hypothetical protein QBC39DRAFT_133974 [Schizothecium conicum]